MDDIGDFFYVRHGLTQANADGLLCGSKWDIALAEKGIAQAKLASTALKEHTSSIDFFLVSPLLRTRQTAAIFAELFPNSQIIEIDEFAEWDLGEWDHQPFEQLKNEFLGHHEPPGGETRSEFRARVTQGLSRISEFSGSKLIVSHGAFSIDMLNVLEIDQGHFENCQVSKIFKYSDKWSAETIYRHKLED